MHRAVLEACLPGLVALAVLFAAAWLVVRLSGARLRPWRIAELHRCQAGGVQSLALVITLPVFLMILLFIVQVSQLMIALMTVNYAAFAAARSAAVWVPALVDDQDFYVLDDDGNGLPDDDSQNRLPPGFRADEPRVLRYQDVRQLGSAKLDEIFHAAAIACAPISPSRDLSSTDLSALGATRTDDVMVRLFDVLAPASADPRLSRRLQNKFAYSLQNTEVAITYTNKDSAVGPTYNPPPSNPWHGVDPRLTHVENEVGWEDAVTVEVRHNFALLPGPGRFLSSVVVGPGGRPDDVAPRIIDDDGVHKTWIAASATLTVEGLQSVRPYIQRDW